MRKRSLGGMRLVAVSIAGLVAVMALIGGLRSAIQRGSAADAIVGIFLAGAIFGGGLLVAMRKGRAGMLVLLGALGGWILWVIVTAPATFDGLIPWWIALGAAAGLASWRQEDV